MCKTTRADSKGLECSVEALISSRGRVNWHARGGVADDLSRLLWLLVLFRLEQVLAGHERRRALQAQVARLLNQRVVVLSFLWPQRTTATLNGHRAVAN